jgi:hypothetical protein
MALQGGLPAYHKACGAEFNPAYADMVMVFKGIHSIVVLGLTYYA